MNGNQTTRTRWEGIGKAVRWIVVLVVVLFVIGGHVIRFIGFGPLPKPIATRLGDIDATGKSVQFLVGRAKAENGPEALTQVRAEYEALAVSVNQALQRINDGISQNTIDTAAATSALDALKPGETALREHLSPLSKRLTKGDLGDDLKIIWKIVVDGVTVWEQVFKDMAEKRKAAGDMLKRMEWPDWENIPKKSMLDE